jgi:hypothetical protein
LAAAIAALPEFCSPKAELTFCLDLAANRKPMPHPPIDPDPLLEAVDLPSLLATTAARQALTPTAQMQARLAGQSNTGNPQKAENPPSSFSRKTLNRLSQKNAY